MAGQPEAPEMPPMPNMMPMLIVMMLTLGLYMVDGQSHVIGKYLDYVLGVLDFNGAYPVLTLMIAGTIMILLSSVLRSLKTDMIQQTRNQKIMAAFNKELRQARIENNLYKVKKLTDLQPTMMAKSMESSTSMMNVMPYTMIVIIPIFLWLRYFLDVTVRAAGNLVIAVPWASVDLYNLIWFMPSWILVYTLVSIPLGQVFSRIVRYFQFKKRLDEINSTPAPVEEV